MYTPGEDIRFNADSLEDNLSEYTCTVIRDDGDEWVQVAIWVKKSEVTR